MPTALTLFQLNDAHGCLNLRQELFYSPSGPATDNIRVTGQPNQCRGRVPGYQSLSKNVIN